MEAHHAQATATRRSACFGASAVSETRKLAAILVSDIVGYSRLTEADEDRILARLRTLCSDLIDPTIALHHGRILSFWPARVRSELRGAFLTGRKQWTDALF
jgi:class 3 adenylate cyclase